MYKTKLRSQSKSINKNKKSNKQKNNQKSVSVIMDNSFSPAHKRLREVVETTHMTNTPSVNLCKDQESLYLNKPNSPFRLLQVMDKRFEKLSEQLQTTIQTMFRECENRLLSQIDKRLNITMSELNKLSERVLTLETTVQEIKNTASDKLIAHTDENAELKTEIECFKKFVQKQENSIVAHDLRINGIPRSNNENLFEMYRLICETIKINPPEVKEIFRVQINKNNNYISNKKKVCQMLQ